MQKDRELLSSLSHRRLNGDDQNDREKKLTIKRGAGSENEPNTECVWATHSLSPAWGQWQCNPHVQVLCPIPDKNRRNVINKSTGEEVPAPQISLVFLLLVEGVLYIFLRINLERGLACALGWPRKSLIGGVAWHSHSLERVAVEVSMGGR